MSLQLRSHQYSAPSEVSADTTLTPLPMDSPTKPGKTALVSFIIQVMRDRKSCKSTRGPWDTYSLDHKGYQELEQRLQEDESLNAYMRLPNTPRLACIQGESAQFVKKIKAQGSSRIKFKDENYGPHSPDAQFRHSEAHYPGIVIEVSYTQKRKDLRKLADQYILGSDGDIKVVVGLDIEYKASKQATLSVWRPAIVKNQVGEKELVSQAVIEDKIFRDSDGNPSTDERGGLVLRLRDFAPDDLVGSKLGDPIITPLSQLFTFLQKAEKHTAPLMNNTGITRSIKPWVRKRALSSSPVEELSERDEKKIREAEDRAEYKQ
ncbi:hypothetical protein QTJ16_006146 [Diplocarpon rosae]|uniref:Uncharacterized protein n=1 Tax=Diplocarpon rosae TaxID=946125 RepID=A0AAD9WCA9_9HELO|nr:hypothetical protein QTJ16_006146 [Diplocarpon rosae]